MKRVLLAMLVATAVSACASNHDLKKGNNNLGGGVEREEVMPGLHYILARTNWAPWKNLSAATKSWKKIADATCGLANYKEIGTTEAARDTGIQPIGVLAYIVTEKKGYALCGGSATTEQEAAAFIAKNGSPGGVR